MGVFVSSFFWFLIIVSVLVAASSAVGIGLGAILLADSQTVAEGVGSIIGGIIGLVISIGAFMYWLQEKNEPAHQV